MMNTPKFRSVEEIKRWISMQQEQVREDSMLVDQLVTQLAASFAKVPVLAAEFKFLDISGDAPKRRKRTVDLKFPVVKVPNGPELKKHYAAAEKLSEQYKLILNTQNEIRMNFKGGLLKDHTSQSYHEMMGAMEKLKTDLETTLRKLFASLANIAQGHAPKEYMQFMEELTEQLGKVHIECDSARSMTYAALDKEGALVFGGYIILQNAVNDEGRVLPHLYVVVKWTVGGDVEIFVESEFVAPTLLHHGTMVEKMAEAVTAIRRQLTLEGFSAQVGTLPVSMQLRTPNSGLHKDLFQASEYIKDVKAEPNELIFILTTSDKSTVDQVSASIYLEIKALLKKKRSTTVRMKLEGNKLVFTFSNLEHDGLHPQDLAFLEDKYDLNPTQLRKIVNVLKG